MQAPTYRLSLVRDIASAGEHPPKAYLLTTIEHCLPSLRMPLQYAKSGLCPRRTNCSGSVTENENEREIALSPDADSRDWSNCDHSHQQAG